MKRRHYPQIHSRRIVMTSPSADRSHMTDIFDFRRTGRSWSRSRKITFIHVFQITECFYLFRNRRDQRVFTLWISCLHQRTQVFGKFTSHNYYCTRSPVTSL